jgi:hypothetical protein
MPPGSRRATITPASAVRVSRSPPRQPSAAMVVRSATRPEASMRPNPYTTSGRSGGLASGIGRPAPGPPCRRRPGLAPGITGATGLAVMAASRTGGGCAAGSPGGCDDPPPGMRVRAVRGLGEIAPVCVSEGGLELTELGMHRGTCGDTVSRPEQGRKASRPPAGRHPEQSHTLARVSGRVSRLEVAATSISRQSETHDPVLTAVRPSR